MDVAKRADAVQHAVKKWKEHRLKCRLLPNLEVAIWVRNTEDCKENRKGPASIYKQVPYQKYLR